MIADVVSTRALPLPDRKSQLQGGICLGPCEEETCYTWGTGGKLSYPPPGSQLCPSNGGAKIKPRGWSQHLAKNEAVIIIHACTYYLYFHHLLTNNTIYLPRINFFSYLMNQRYLESQNWPILILGVCSRTTGPSIELK